jgi:hypothetical protein
MSRPLQIAKYPAAFLDLANEFEKGRKVRIITCDSPKAAKAMRLDLYGFTAALRAEGMQADYPQFLTVRMFIEGKRLRLVIADETAKALK